MQIPYFRPSIGEREIEAAIGVLRSGWLTTGPKCIEFEKKIAYILGDNIYTLAVNSYSA